MDSITLGHWLFALIGSGIYILYCLWGYRKEYTSYKKFNFKIIPTIIYMSIILTILILIS